MARLTGGEIERGSAPAPWERDGDATARDPLFTRADLDPARAIDATVARVA